MTAEVVRASTQNQGAMTIVSPTSIVNLYQVVINSSSLWKPGRELGQTDKDTSGLLTTSTLFVSNKDPISTQADTNNNAEPTEPTEQGE